MFRWLVCLYSFVYVDYLERKETFLTFHFFSFNCKIPFEIVRFLNKLTLLTSTNNNENNEKMTMVVLYCDVVKACIEGGGGIQALDRDWIYPDLYHQILALKG